MGEGLYVENVGFLGGGGEPQTAVGLTRTNSYGGWPYEDELIRRLGLRLQAPVGLMDFWGVGEGREKKRTK